MGVRLRPDSLFGFSRNECSAWPEYATNEARAASEWYAARDLRVAEAFEAALDEAIDRLAAVPGVGSPWPGEAGVQRVLLSGFPYSVAFYDARSEVVVIAVAHQKRKPGYWRR